MEPETTILSDGTQIGDTNIVLSLACVETSYGELSLSLITLQSLTGRLKHLIFND